jgi:4'-phosphopantetheinyl transferase
MGHITVNNHFTADIEWNNIAGCNFVTGDVVDTWKVDVAAHCQYIGQFSKVLTPDEMARARRYLRKQDHDNFIISRASLRFILSKYLQVSPVEIRFQSGKNNKPLIAYPGQTGINFNLSDSNERVMITVAQQETGADVEWIKPEFRYHDILQLNFNQPEIDFILADEPLFRFFLLWTRKEALLKATGIGLTEHLRDIHSLNGRFFFDGNIISTQNDWDLKSFMMDASYVATIATPFSIKKISFYYFNYSALIY